MSERTSLQIRAARPDEVERVRAVQHRAFNIPVRPDSRPAPDPDDVRVATLDGAIVGALVLHRFGQFYGGRSIPSIGIGGVAVTPEARGRQVAERLVTETLHEVGGLGFALSCLYPATVPVYRRCGYEFAGFRVRYRAPLHHLPRRAGPETEPWDDGDLDEIQACYREFAGASSGLIDRPRAFWERRVLASFESKEVYRICVREDGRVTGYAIYEQAPHAGSSWGFNIECRDLVYTTPGAAAALMTFFSRHRSNGTDLLWTGPPTDPLALLLPEQDASHDSWFRPMLRLVDVPGALEARGFPSRLEAAIEIRVEDPVIEGNDAGWRVEVTGGTAKVSPEPGARARVDVGTLAAIYAGMVPARTARWLGRLDADDATTETLDQLFPGPAPWILDWF